MFLLFFYIVLAVFLLWAIAEFLLGDSNPRAEVKLSLPPEWNDEALEALNGKPSPGYFPELVNRINDWLGYPGKRYPNGEIVWLEDAVSVRINNDGDIVVWNDGFCTVRDTPSQAWFSLFEYNPYNP